MTTTLSEGVKVPDVGSVNWAGDLEVNWNLLNGALANLSGNVKLDRDNTWTGEQSFTLPIVGSITGTASKAIADEDGINIKSGYVNVAGNQTVTGDKSFTGSNTFNNILPNATSTYSLGSSSYQWSSVYAQKLYLNGTEFGLGISNYFTDNQMIRTAQSIDIANNPSVEIVGKALRFVDNNRFWSQWVPVWATDGSVRFEMGIANYTTTGTQKYTTVAYKVTKDWSTLSFYSTHSNSNLGTSTNQWSSVYAQTYYYNGTQWGLDKANEWTGDNSFTSGFSLKNTSWSGATPPSSTKTTALEFKNSDTLQNRIASRVSSSASEMWLETTRNVDSNTSHTLRLTIFVDSTGNCIFAPYNPNNTDLGTSNNGYKWKTLNGINPGALSLPDLNASNVNLNTTGWDLINYGPNRYTALMDGYIVVSGTMDCLQIDIAGKPFGLTINKGNDGFCICSIPIIKGDVAQIRLKNCTNLRQAKFYPMLGNV